VCDEVGDAMMMLLSERREEAHHTPGCRPQIEAIRALREAIGGSIQVVGVPFSVIRDPLDRLLSHEMMSICCGGKAAQHTLLLLRACCCLCRHRLRVC
jgi:hypothetical protein